MNRGYLYGNDLVIFPCIQLGNSSMQKIFRLISHCAGENCTGTVPSRMVRIFANNYLERIAGRIATYSKFPYISNFTFYSAAWLYSILIRSISINSNVASI